MFDSLVFFLKQPKKVAFFVMKLAFIAAAFSVLYTWILRAGGWETLKSVILNMDAKTAVFWLTMAVLVKLAGISCGIVRWRLLLRAQGIVMPFWYLAKCWFMGRAVGLWVPGTIGLDGYRLIASASQTGEVVKCAGVILVEKLLGFTALATLIFLTLPLGTRFLDFNPVLLVALETMVIGFIAVAALILLNPRIVQVLVMVLPTPAKIRNEVHKLGTAIDAYSQQKGTLFVSLLLGIGVYMGISLMFFCTASAVQAPNTSLLDILFTSPLMSFASIVTPTVSGMGVRELFFGYFHAEQAGAAPAVLFGHLGYWTGEVAPFLLSIPLLLFTTRPKREEITTELEEARRAAAQAQQAAAMSPETVALYRNRLANILLAGLYAGLLTGALAGLAESFWVLRWMGGLGELRMFWWGAIAYAFLFAFAGLGLAGGIAFVSLLLDRFPAGRTTFALSLGVLAAGATGGLGAWRLFRDILERATPGVGRLASIAVAAVVVGLVLGVGAWLALRPARPSRRTATAAALGGLVVLLVVGVVTAAVLSPKVEATPFAPSGEADGPNILFIGIDTLRADYLPLFNPEAEAKTPNLNAFAQDAVVFKRAFSNASWTKPAFATLFTGLYPEAHGATSQNAVLPDGITTLAEALAQEGYYTKAFANNPNITALFRFGQGFADYVDLKPDLYFGGTESVTKLTAYQILRRVRERIMDKLPRFLGGGRMDVRAHYQPAEVVTEHALAWLASDQRPKEAPFYLFAHYMDPHDPYMNWENPGEGYARAKTGHPDPDEFLEPMRRAYLSEIRHLDQYLGALFAGLKQQGLYDNTLIVLTADHGEEFYDHEGWWHGMTLYDEVMSVPLIIKLPGNRAAGTVNTDFARHIDLAPTMLSMAGAAVPEAMSGQPLLTAEGEALNQEIGLVYGHNDFEGSTLHAVRTHIDKLIQANEDNRRGLEPVEYYDLEADPGEQHNLAGERPESVTDLDRVIQQMQRYIEGTAAEPEAVEELPEELEQQMQDIGYVGSAPRPYTDDPREDLVSDRG